MLKRIKEKLDTQLAGANCRTEHVRSNPQDTHTKIASHNYLNFSSNDYLGLANDPELAQVHQQHTATWGVGSGSSRLLGGTTTAHRTLEARLAHDLGTEDCCLFTCGYMANLALIATLFDSDDLIIHDRQNHASLIDATRQAGVKFQRFGHCDLNSLHAKFSSCAATPQAVICEGLYSMSGQRPDLMAYAKLTQANSCLLIIDDAHGFGISPSSKYHHPGLPSSIPHDISSHPLTITIATFGKACGGSGAFIAGSKTIIDYLRQFARPYIYTTALPASICATNLTALEMIATQSWRQERLQENIHNLRHALAGYGVALTSSATSPIQYVRCGDSHKALDLSQALHARHIFCRAIRPPTVAHGNAGLRISLSAKHTPEDIKLLTDILGESLCQ